MTLRDDLNHALQTLADANSGISLTELDDDGQAQLTVTVPAALTKLHDNQLVIDVRLAASDDDDAFTLSTPLLAITSFPPEAKLMESMLRLNFDDSLRGRVSMAIADAGEIDVLVGMCHWTLDSITPDQFAQLYKRYLMGVIDLIDELNEQSRGLRSVRQLHEGRPD
jgi:hypothetical protein